MPTAPIASTAAGLSLLAIPVLNLVSALCATASVKTDSHGEIAAIAANPSRFYVYAITQLIGAYLFIPAFIAVKNLMRERRPRWADLAGGILLLGLLVAIGDAAVEMTWQMGTAGANADQMAALLDRYENAAGSALPHAIGGIAILISAVAFVIGLCRSRVVPVWSAIAVGVALFANIVGYASGSQAVLLPARSLCWPASAGSL
jgi:hypothetical protein